MDYFSDQTNLDMLNRLAEAGAAMTAGSEEIPASEKLKGLSFVLTGTLPALSRKDASEIISQNGGKVVTSVSKITSYVLAGENSGSKLQKAKKLQIEIITEEDLLKMI